LTRLWVVVLTAVLLTSCDQSTSRVSVLWTDVPEMASYAEKFNASQREWQILVEYRQAPARLLTTPGRKADLVVARDLASSEVMNTLVPLEFLFDGGNMAKASFYRRILDAGTQGDRTKLLPVSFDLPVLLYSPAQIPDLPGFSLDVPTLQGLNRSFNEASPRSLAFSPRWGDFAFTLALLEGADFHEGFQGALAWDTTKLGQSLSTYYGWPTPSWDQTSEFTTKYLQTDPGPLLSRGRVQFYPSTLGTLFSRAWEDRRDLDFRFVDRGGRVAAGAVVWAGIPSSSLNRGAAERFLGWFFHADTQKSLMTQARAEDPRAFGLAGGLSAQTEPNLQVLPNAYPDLAGRVPTHDQVTFWPTLPLNWAELRTQVIAPWLSQPDANGESLKDALEQYRTRTLRN